MTHQADWKRALGFAAAVLLLALPILLPGCEPWQHGFVADEDVRPASSEETEGLPTASDVRPGSAMDVPIDLDSWLLEKTGHGLVSRPDWGANPDYRAGTKYLPVTGIVIHHTATPNGSEETMSIGARLHEIQRYAKEVKVPSLLDIEYHYLIDEGGRVYEGRAGTDSEGTGYRSGVVFVDGALQAVRGNHAGTANDWKSGDTAGYTIGIAFVGCFLSDSEKPNQAALLFNPVDEPSKLAVDSAMALIEWIGQYAALGVDSVFAHRDVEGDKSHCPGYAVYTLLPQFRAAAGVQDIALSASSLPATKSGGTEMLTVTAPTPKFPWQAYRHDTWITIKASWNGYGVHREARGSRTVSYALGANYGMPREGKISVGGHVVAIIQDGRVTTGKASNVTPGTATLSGKLNPNGNPATYFFQYGTTPSYGMTTTPRFVESGTSEVPATAELSGLLTNTTYYYRLTASNRIGAATGADGYFRTASGQNQPPTISSLTAGSSTIAPLGSTQITVSASDPESDSLTYTWSATGGALSGTTGAGAKTWTAPNTTGPYSITVAVTDGKPGHIAATKSVSVSVATNQPPTITSASGSPSAVSPGRTMTLFYNVKNAGAATQVLLGASIRSTGGTILSDSTNDKKVTVASGSSTVSRAFVVPAAASLGTYDLLVALWWDTNNNGAIDTADTQFSLKTYPGSVSVQKFMNSDRVQVYQTGGSGLKVRSAPCSTEGSPPTRPDGATGTIVGGPQRCSLSNGTEYTWWKITWDTVAITGWSADLYLRRY